LKIIPAFIHRRLAHRPNLVQIVENIGWLFLDKILRLGFGLIVGVWLARYLGPEHFGQLSFATAFVDLFSAIAVLGLHGIVVRDIVRNPEGAPETLGTAAMLLVFSGLLFYLLTLSVITYLRPEDTLARTLIAILGSTMLLKVSDIAVYWFEAQVQSKYTVWVQNSVFLVFAAVKVVLIIQEAHLTAFAWAMLSEAVASGVVLLFVLGKRGLAISSFCYRAGRAKSLLKDSWPLILSAIAIAVHIKIGQIMLGEMVDNKAVGIYSAATRISEVWYFVIPIVVASVFPTLAALHANRSDLLPKRWVQAYALMFWLSVGTALMVTVLSDFIVNFLFGEAYSDAAIVLTIHVWLGVHVAVGSVWSRWLLLENKLHIGMYAHLVASILNIGLNIWLIPAYGVVGASIAALASTWISAIFAYSLHKPNETFAYLGRAILLRRAVWN
jgi:O-antigen/teichoic acid export membrane protein